MKKFLLTLLVLMSFGFVAKADEATFKVESGSLTTNDDITITISKANGGTQPRWDATYVRAYAKNTIAISGAEGVTITNVLFKTESSNGSFLSGASADKGTFNASGKEWTGSEQSFVITNGTVSSGHTRINTFIVTYTKENAGPVACSVPEFSVEDGANVYAGTVISVKKGNATSITLTANGEPVEGTEYTVPADAALGSSITLEANSTLEGGEPATASASITVNVIEKTLETFDFEKRWNNLTSSEVKVETTITSEGLTAVVNNAYQINNNALFLRQSTGYIILPAFEKPVEKIVIYGASSCAADATVKVSGEDLPTVTTGKIKNSAETVEVNSTVVGVQYKIASDNSKNAQISKIEVYFGALPEPATEIVNFTHDGIVSKAHVASLKYTLHVANHKDDSMYTVTLTLKDKDGVEVSATNEEHSLVEAPVAMAPARAATATHYLSGSVGFDDLTPEMTYTPTVSYGLKGAEPTGSVELPAITMLTTGIEDVAVDGNEAAEYFNLQGVRVAQPEAGQIYIVRRGANVVKELVK